MSKAEQKELADEYNQLFDLGMSQTDAFTRATKYLGIELKNEIGIAEKRGEKRANMAIPSSNNVQETKEVKLVDKDPTKDKVDMVEWGNAQAAKEKG